MNKFIIICSLFSIISCAHICREDGLFVNPNDKTSYIECKGGNPYFKRCPEAEDGLSYLIFVGKECVLPQMTTENLCPPGSYYDKKTGTCNNKVPTVIKAPYTNDPDVERYIVHAKDITCPFGTAYDSNSGRCQRKELADRNRITDRVLTHSDSSNACPTGFTYVPSLDKCRSVSFVSPIKVPVKPRYACPSGFTYESALRRCRRLTWVDHTIQQSSSPCPFGFDYVPSLNKCRKRYEQAQPWPCPWKSGKTRVPDVQGRILGKIISQK